MIMFQLITAVDCLHQADIYHRDLKPHNVLVLDESGDLNPRVCLIDFGLATTKEEAEKQINHCGTPNYIDPELLQAR